MAVGDRVGQFRDLARQAFADLFDQHEPFGRLALVQVLMIAGDTLVTISLAGSLFFSISPTEAKSKVFLYLVLTLAPFAVVSPLLGPLIDRNRGGRRAMVVFAAVGRAAICPLMARDTHSLLLFPEAFMILVLSKLYLVTRGALVPEMAAITREEEAMRPAAEPGQDGEHGEHGEPEGDTDQRGGATPVDQPALRPPGRRRTPVGYAAMNARLTLLGTLAGFAVSVPGILLLRLSGSPAVLIMDAFVFVGAALAGLRLPMRRLRLGRQATARSTGSLGASPAVSAVAGTAGDPDLVSLQPMAHPEVIFGLTTMSLIRGLAGFLVFLLAFGLRREHAALSWYGLALGASGIGALLGLTLVGRLRQRLVEQQILLGSIWLIALAAAGAAFWSVLPAQVALAFIVGVAGSLAQPSFDAMAQRYVPAVAQGRAFARFATRQQLIWCLGALIPVVIALPFPAGNLLMAAVGAVGGLFYVTSRRALRTRALPRPHGSPA